MYFGGLEDGSAANHVIFELVANSIDQFLSGNGGKIEVTVDQRSITVQDNGAGLPFENVSRIDSKLNEAEEYLQTPHFGATANNHAPHVHCTFHGLGLAAVNAVSRVLDVRSDNSTQVWWKSYAAGLPIGKAKFEKSLGFTGTEFHLELEPAFANPDLTRLKTALRDQVFLFPGLTLTLNGEIYFSENGLLDMAVEQVEKQAKGQLYEPVIATQLAREEFRLQIALLGTKEDCGFCRTWVNGVETVEGGTHLTALNRALSQVKWKPAVKLLHVIMEEPEFAGPTKQKLRAPQMMDKMEQAFAELLGK